MLFRSYKTSIILQLITVAVIKIYSETLSVKYHRYVETDQLICKAINGLVSIWYELLLKGIFKQAIVQAFLKGMLVSRKQSSINSLKISCCLTLFWMGWGNFTPPAAFFYCEKLRWACGPLRFFSEPNLFLHVFWKFELIWTTRSKGLNHLSLLVDTWFSNE